MGMDGMDGIKIEFFVIIIEVGMYHLAKYLVYNEYSFNCEINGIGWRYFDGRNISYILRINSNNNNNIEMSIHVDDEYEYGQINNRSLYTKFMDYDKDYGSDEFHHVWAVLGLYYITVCLDKSYAYTTPFRSSKCKIVTILND